MARVAGEGVAEDEEGRESRGGMAVISAVNDDAGTWAATAKRARKTESIDGHRDGAADVFSVWRIPMPPAATNRLQADKTAFENNANISGANGPKA